MTQIHFFTYRNPRLAASLPVEFLTDEGVLAGQIRDISERGLAVDFSEPLTVGTQGRVRFRTGHCLFELQTQVLHTEGFTAGLAFAFASDREASFVRSVLQALSRDA